MKNIKTLVTIEHMTEILAKKENELKLGLPEGYDNWELVSDRIEFIHNNYNSSLDIELSNLEEKESAVSNLSYSVGLLRESVNCFVKKEALGQLFLKCSNERSVMVFNWQDANDFINDEKTGLITNYDIVFKNGNRGGNEGINAGAYLHGLMNEVGVYEIVDYK